MSRTFDSMLLQSRRSNCDYCDVVWLDLHQRISYVNRGSRARQPTLLLQWRPRFCSSAHAARFLRAALLGLLQVVRWGDTINSLKMHQMSCHLNGYVVNTMEPLLLLTMDMWLSQHVWQAGLRCPTFPPPKCSFPCL